MKNSKLLFMVLSLFILTVPLVGFQITFAFYDTPSFFHPTDEPIRIRNNAGLAALASYGDGSKSNPYYIVNLQLAVTDEEVALDISNTNAYFILQTSRILVLRGIYAILFHNVTNGVIDDCEIVEGSLGLYHSNSCELVANVVSGPSSEISVDLWFCRDVKISDNTIQDSTTGISLVGCEDIWLSANHISDSTYAGIDIYLSGNITMHDNTFDNSGVTLSLWGSAGANGVMIEGSQYIDVPYNFENNTVNGKQLGFFNQVTNTSISATIYGQVILLNCTNIDIYGGRITNASVGVQVFYSRNCTITESTIEYNPFDGVYIFESNTIKVSECEIRDNGAVGVRMENSNNTLIQENDISGNEGAGIHIARSHECRVLNNSVSRNAYGVSLYSSSNCSVIDNAITLNTVYGIHILSQSHHNSIYANRIGWNSVNALDESTANYWDDGVSQGNSWSDWSGFGVYEIDYYGIDHYPSMFGGGLSLPIFIMIGLGLTGIIGIVIAFIWNRRRMLERTYGHSTERK